MLLSCHVQKLALITCHVHLHVPKPIQSRYKDRGAWAIFSNIEIHLCGCSLAKAFLFFWSYHDTKLATYWLKFTIFVSFSIQQIFSYISHNDNKCHDPAIIRNISQANIADTPWWYWWWVPVDHQLIIILSSLHFIIIQLTTSQSSANFILYIHQFISFMTCKSFQLTFMSTWQIINSSNPWIEIVNQLVINDSKKSNIGHQIFLLNFEYYLILWIENYKRSQQVTKIMVISEQDYGRLWKIMETQLENEKIVNYKSNLFLL